jgi:hypothetical protein
MPNLIEQAIDTSILAFKTKSTEQSSTENRICPAPLFAALTEAGPSGSPRPEERNTVQDHLHASNDPCLQSVGESLDLMPDLRQQISTPSTIDSDSILREANQSGSVAEGSVFNVVQQDGDHSVGANGHVEGNASIPISAKGKQKAVYQPDEGHDDEDFPADLDHSHSYLHSDFTFQDDHFGHLEFQEDMNWDFEDMFLDSGLEYKLD